MKKIFIIIILALVGLTLDAQKMSTLISRGDTIETVNDTTWFFSYDSNYGEIKATRLNNSYAPLQNIYAEYLNKDDIRNTVIIDQAGNGDFTTFSAAYAATTDCAFDNQYEFIVYPGLYEEDSLMPPEFSHTYGLNSNAVQVQNEGEDTSPVFETSNGSMKLSNLTIISQGNTSGYCIHYDAGGDYAMRIFTNLILIKEGVTDVGSNSIIGGGAKENYTAIFRNCKYLAETSGNPSMHSQQGTGNYTVVEHINENAGSRRYAFGSVGGYGYHEARFVNCVGIKGVISAETTVAAIPPGKSLNWWEYPANNSEWIFTGGGNKNFVIDPDANYGEALLATSTIYDTSFTITGTAKEALFGNYIYTEGGTRIYAKVKGFWDVRDIQNAGTYDVIQLWNRLGDCSTTSKNLILTMGDSVQSYTFNDDYSTLETAEATIIAAINDSLTLAPITKTDGSDNYDNVLMAEKIIIPCSVDTCVLRYEFIRISGTDFIIAEENCDKNNIVGIAVNEAAPDEPLEIWSGPIYLGSGNGEYGIGSDGKLDISQSNKIGLVINGSFYPYY